MSGVERNREMLNRGRVLLSRGASAVLVSLVLAAHPQVASASEESDVLGFEAVTGWSASSGAVSSSTVRSQGNRALGLRNFSYSELVSAPLSTLRGVSSEIAIDVRPPVSPPWGELQVFVTSPTLNLTNAWVGVVSLIGLPANTFSELRLPVPPAIEQALKGSYSDLRIKVVLNVPYATSHWVLDDLHFSGDGAPDCAEGSAYTLLISGEQGVDPAHVETMRCTFYEVYPLLAARFNPDARTTVGMIFTDEPGVAWAWEGDTYYNKSFLASAPLDSDVVVHETMHIVQEGYTGEVPGWIIEGTADYVRDAYGLYNEENGWSIPTGYGYGQHYRNGYGDAAAFFKWIDAHYRQGQLPVADALDDIMRQGQYSEQTFVALTGHDVDDLWFEYSGGAAPQPAASGVIVFQDRDFAGDDFTLAPGTYSSTDLRARGFNDRISSLIVPSGFTVTVYDDDFSGASAVYSADQVYVGDALNDKISSIVIQ
jgi:basic secretory peptidase family protein